MSASTMSSQRPARACVREPINEHRSVGEDDDDDDGNDDDEYQLGASGENEDEVELLDLLGQRFEDLYIEIPEQYAKSRLYKYLTRVVVRNGKRFEEMSILVELEGSVAIYVKQLILPPGLLKEHDGKLYVDLRSQKELDDKNFFAPS